MTMPPPFLHQSCCWVPWSPYSTNSFYPFLVHQECWKRLSQGHLSPSANTHHSNQKQIPSATKFSNFTSSHFPTSPKNSNLAVLLGKKNGIATARLGSRVADSHEERLPSRSLRPFGRPHDALRQQRGGHADGRGVFDAIGQAGHQVVLHLNFPERPGTSQFHGKWRFRGDLMRI